MSSWEKLLSPAPEATSWPPQLMKSCRGPASTARKLSFLKCRSPPSQSSTSTLTSRRRRSPGARSRASFASGTSCINSSSTKLSLDMNSGNSRGDVSCTAGGSPSTLPRETTAESRVREEAEGGVAPGSVWGDRRRRNSSNEFNEWQDGRKRRLSSRGIVIDSSVEETLMTLGESERVDSSVNVPQSRRMGGCARRRSSRKAHHQGSTASAINHTSEGVVEIDSLVRSLAHGAGRKATCCLPSLHGAPSEVTIDSNGPESAPSLSGEGQSVKSNTTTTVAQRNVGSAQDELPGEPGIVVTVWRDLVKGFVPGAQGFVPTGQEKRKAFHNFVYRRRRHGRPRNGTAHEYDLSRHVFHDDDPISQRPQAVVATHSRGADKSREIRSSTRGGMGTGVAWDHRRETATPSSQKWSRPRSRQMWEEQHFPTPRRSPTHRAASRDEVLTNPFDGGRDIYKPHRGCCASEPSSQRRRTQGKGGRAARPISCRRCGSTKVQLFRGSRSPTTTTTPTKSTDEAATSLPLHSPPRSALAGPRGRRHLQRIIPQDYDSLKSFGTGIPDRGSSPPNATRSGPVIAGRAVPAAADQIATGGNLGSQSQSLTNHVQGADLRLSSARGMLSDSGRGSWKKEWRHRERQGRPGVDLRFVPGELLMPAQA